MQEMEGKIAGWDRHFAEALQGERRLLASAAGRMALCPGVPRLVACASAPALPAPPTLRKHQFEEEEVDPQAQLCENCLPDASADQPRSGSDAAGWQLGSALLQRRPWARSTAAHA